MYILVSIILNMKVDVYILYNWNYTARVEPFYLTVQESCTFHKIYGAGKVKTSDKMAKWLKQTQNQQKSKRN